jgi:hypothetical protein
MGLLNLACSSFIGEEYSSEVLKWVLIFKLQKIPYTAVEKFLGTKNKLNIWILEYKTKIFLF